MHAAGGESKAQQLEGSRTGVMEVGWLESMAFFIFSVRTYFQRCHSRNETCSFNIIRVFINRCHDGLLLDCNKSECQRGCQREKYSGDTWNLYFRAKCELLYKDPPPFLNWGLMFPQDE